MKNVPLPSSLFLAYSSIIINSYLLIKEDLFMENENISLVRIEERTRSLEQSDKKHFFMEAVLFLAILALALFLVVGCSIETPKDVTIPTVKEKKWVYRDMVENDKLDFTLDEDEMTVTVIYNEKSTKTLREGDSYTISPLRKTLKCEFTNEKITVYSNSEILATFTLE